VESRYVVTCNGRRVPLTSAGEPGVVLAGIRYRARQLSTTLHPTIPVHAPLVFELIDTWRERSMGQCTYHVGPPDGRIYEGRPGSAAEAEERRRERFQVTSLTPGRVTVQSEELNPSFPMTLDLRLPKHGQTTRTESERQTP
jgi:uncharacterized protein (DUF2126 family)